MSTLADHYADALADVAMAQNAAAQIRGELADFCALLRDSPELNVLLGSPAVSRENKQGVLEAVVKDLGASHTLRNFLFVVLDRRRMALLPEIQLAFDAQLDERQGFDASRGDFGAGTERCGKGATSRGARTHFRAAAWKRSTSWTPR